MNKRYLNIRNGYNYRDIGGYKTKSGQQVKWHKVIRSGNLADLSTADQQCLIDYGVRTDIDLRSRQEQSKNPDRVPKGVEYHFSPIFNSSRDNKIDRLKQLYSNDPKFGYKSMLKTYQFFVSSSEARHGYRILFRDFLKNDGPYALIFHCSQGKDRTGMGAAMLLLVLGVDVQTTKADYLLSKDAMKPYIQLKIKQVEKYHVNENFKQNMYDLYTVHGAYFDSAMDKIKERYGNITNFAHQFLALSDNKIQKLKQIYLTD